MFLLKKIRTKRTNYNESEQEEGTNKEQKSMEIKNRNNKLKPYYIKSSKR